MKTGYITVHILEIALVPTTDHYFVIELSPTSSVGSIACKVNCEWSSRCTYYWLTGFTFAPLFELLLAAAGALCGFVFPWRIDMEWVFLRVPTLSISGTIQERTRKGGEHTSQLTLAHDNGFRGLCEKGEFGQVGENRWAATSESWYSHFGITWFTIAGSWIYSHKLVTHLILQVLTQKVFWLYPNTYPNKPQCTLACPQNSLSRTL